MTDEELFFARNVSLGKKNSGIDSFVCHVLWELEKKDGASLHLLGSFELICVTSRKSAEHL